MNSKTITREELCGLFDHTNLKAYAQEEDFKKLCDEAAANHLDVYKRQRVLRSVRIVTVET